MIHLKNISHNDITIEKVDKVFESAKEELKILEKGGADAAIIENYFDAPYDTTLTDTQIVTFTNIFSRLKDQATIPLGVNLQQTNGIEEIIVANICGGSFVRSEAYVETRLSSAGLMEPQASKMIRYKKDTNSQVKILADVNVKHSIGLIDKPMEVSFTEAIDAGADAIIITGKETGKSPTVKDFKIYKKLFPEIPLIVGSGVSEDNIEDFFEYADAVIVGSAIKDTGIDSKVSLEKVRNIVHLKGGVK